MNVDWQDHRIPTSHIIMTNKQFLSCFILYISCIHLKLNLAQTLGSGLGQIPVPSLVGVIEITVPELCKFFAPQTFIFRELLRVFGWPLILNQEKLDVCKCTVIRFYSYLNRCLRILIYSRCKIFFS